MCGIVGSVGLHNPHDYILDGLKLLNYRGYDSAGLAYFDHGIKIYKDKGSVEHLETLVPHNFSSLVAIGHTRWATHGVANKTNSHPHLSYHQKIVVVHNGVIENYQEIKNFLLKEKYDFYSETDTEVIANLLDYFYTKNNDMLMSIKESISLINGSYAICLFNDDHPDVLYVMKRSSPLLIGHGDGFNLVSSDASAMIKYTNKFIDLNDKEYGIVTKDNIQIFNEKGEAVNKEYISRDIADIAIDLKGYPHYMVKEIEEIPDVCTKLLSTYYKDGDYHFDKELIDALSKANHIIFIACGTSYHASLVGGRLFESFANISTSEYIASEWANHPRITGEWPFVIMLSQSGETADLISCLKIIEEKKIPSLVITNTEGSTLDRRCQYSLLLHAGKEVSVASTKAYVAQVSLLALIVGAVSKQKFIYEDLLKATSYINNVQNNIEKIRNIASNIKKSESLYFLGRGYDYLLSLEASLKLKEVSYIHSEAFPGGEIKHGPIALIDKNTPVIVFITDEENAVHMRNNIQEVVTRGAKVYVISTKSLAKKDDDIVLDDFPYYLTSVVSSTFAFYLAYYTSLLKGYNVDRPRNLAKSVTVE